MLALSAGASAQEERRGVVRPPARRAPANNTTHKRRSSEAGTRQQQQQRTQKQAIAALLETAEAARSFVDFFAKVRIQTSVADQLWPFDEQAARAILRRAWEATNAPGVVASITFEGESETQAREYLTATQSSVIETAARHDARLSESFMQEFSRALAKETGAPEPDAAPDERASSQSEGWRSLSASGQQRLLIATSLLRGGEYERAAQFAAPLVSEGVTRDLLGFILEFRRAEARAADALYLRLIERTLADAGAEANAVLLLSSPIVSPDLLVSIDKNGALNFSQAFYTDAQTRVASPPVRAEVRRAFFDMAAIVLLRAPAPRADDAKSAGETAARYFTIGRLLPFFEREAAQYAPALHARQSALNSEIEASRREALASRTETRDFARKNSRDPLSSRLEEVARASDEAARDDLRLKLVMEAARLKLWERARRVAAEIADAEAQRNARLVIALYQVLNISAAYGDEEEDDFERAASFVRSADVPPEVRAAGLAQAAGLALRRGKQSRAVELLNEANGFAMQAPADTSQRAAVFALLTLASERADASRVWEMFATLVGAANGAADSLSDAEQGFEFVIATPKEESELFIAPAMPFRLEEVFATMGRLDFSRALSEIRLLKDEVTRAEASVAAARAVLRPAQEKRKAM